MKERERDQKTEVKNESLYVSDRGYEFVCGWLEMGEGGGEQEYDRKHDNFLHYLC